MTSQRKPPFEYSVEELDRELIARGNKTPAGKRFKFADREGTPDRDEVMGQVKKLYDTSASLAPDKALSHICTKTLIKILLFKTGRLVIGGVRGTWGSDDRVDHY